LRRRVRVKGCLLHPDQLVDMLPGPQMHLPLVRDSVIKDRVRVRAKDKDRVKVRVDQLVDMYRGPQMHLPLVRDIL
jgi:hypothetical protein